jgi:hypothetical protein
MYLEPKIQQLFTTFCHSHLFPTYYGRDLVIRDIRFV